MNRKVLLDTVKMLMPGVAKGDLVEQYACIDFEGNTLRTTDGRIFLRAKLDADTGINTAIPGKILYSLLNSIHDDEVSISQSNGSVKIESQNLKGKLFSKEIEATHKVSTIIQEPEESEWKPLPVGMVESIRLCQFSASKDQTTGPLTGVHVSGASAISCDRYRISECQFCSPIEQPLNLSIQLVQELQKHSGNISGYCVRDSLVFFRLYDGKVLLGAGLISGSYPDLSSHFPKKASTDFIEIPDTFIPALERQDMIQSDVELIDKETRVVCDRDTITLFSMSKNAGEVEEKIPYPVPLVFIGAEFMINPVFFLEILEISRKMQIYPETSSLVFTGANLTHLVKMKAEVK